MSREYTPQPVERISDNFLRGILQRMDEALLLHRDRIIAVSPADGSLSVSGVVEFESLIRWADSVSTANMLLGVNSASAVGMIAGGGHNILARLGLSALSVVMGPVSGALLPAPTASRMLTVVDANVVVRTALSSKGYVEVYHPDEVASSDYMITLENAGTLGTNLDGFLVCKNNGVVAFAVEGNGAIAAVEMALLDIASGFRGSFTIGDFGGGATGLTADRAWYIRDVDGDIVMATSYSSTQDAYALRGSSGSVFHSSTASAGASFRDTTTSTKRLRMVLSGAVGNNSITLSNTAARNYGLGNLSGNIVVVGNDPPAVASGSLGIVDLTAQSAAITSTNLSSTPPAGMYLIHYELTTTTADATAGTMRLDVTVTGDGGAVTTPSAALDLATANAQVRGTMERYLASGDVAYAVPVASGAINSAQFAVRIRVMALG